MSEQDSDVDFIESFLRNVDERKKSKTSFKSTSSTSVRGGSSLPKLTLDKPVLPSIGISFNDDDEMESNLTVESIGKVCSTEMFSCSGRKLLDFCALVTFYSGPC